MEGIIEVPYIKINFDITNEFFWHIFDFSGGEMHFVKVIFLRIIELFFFSFTVRLNQSVIEMVGNVSLCY